MTKMKKNLEGKVCIVTGANSGIGKYTSLGLAKMGATVVLLCRNQLKGEEAKEEIIQASGNENVDLILCDLSKFADIYQFVETFKSRYQSLHVLVNNAGVINWGERSTTADGLETTFTINYLAPFLLTHILLDLLKKSAPSRIVNVTLSVSKMFTLDLEDLQLENDYVGMTAYGRSKIALNCFTAKLSKQLEETGVMVNCVYPGVIRTNIMRKLPWLLRVFSKFFRSPKHGANAIIHSATSPEIKTVTGHFFKKKKMKDKAIAYCGTEAMSKDLWQKSLELVQINQN